MVFAAPVAVVGFVLALCLKQVPLRNTAASSNMITAALRAVTPPVRA